MCLYPTDWLRSPSHGCESHREHHHHCDQPQPPSTEPRHLFYLVVPLHSLQLCRCQSRCCVCKLEYQPLIYIITHLQVFFLFVCFLPHMLISSSVTWHCKRMRRRPWAHVSVCLCLSSLYPGWSGWSQHSSCQWLTLVALRLSPRAWAELGPWSSSTCSQYWQLPWSPHATTCNDSPRRFVFTYAQKTQTQINILSQHIWWHSVV